MKQHFICRTVHGFIYFQPPFRGSDDNDIAWSTLHQEPHFPLFVSSTAVDLIRQVCTEFFAWHSHLFHFMSWHECISYSLLKWIILRLLLAFFICCQELQ